MNNMTEYMEELTQLECFINKEIIQLPKNVLMCQKDQKFSPENVNFPDF